LDEVVEEKIENHSEVRPELGGFYSMSIGYNYRKMVKNVNRLFLDVGLSFSYVFNNKSGYQNGRGGFYVNLDKDGHVNYTDSVSDYIHHNSYGFIYKQNFIKLNVKLSYVLI